MSESGVSLEGESPLAEFDIIIIQADDKIFRTTKGTLVKESPFFASRLSNPWHSVDRKLTLDLDPVIFKHVLHYLRHGVFPFFYDQIRGFDYRLYSLVLAQADYLLIERLSSWIREQRYLLAVTKERSTNTIVDRVDSLNGSDPPNTEYHYQFLNGKKRVYVCPRGINIHIKASDCGRQCNNARSDNASDYHIKDELRVVVIKTKTIFNFEVCLEGQTDPTLNS